MSDIRDPNAVIRSKCVAWHFAKHAFRRGIQPTDLDAVQIMPSLYALDNRGKCVVMEFKQEGEKMPRGQERALEEFVKHGMTVMIVVHNVLPVWAEDGWVNPCEDVVRFQVWSQSKPRQRWREWFDGSRFVKALNYYGS